MNINDAKEKLKKDGYTSFDLEDFDKDFFNFLLPLKCNAESNLKDKCNNLRVNLSNDGENKIDDLFVGLSNNNQFKTHENARELANKIFDKLDDNSSIIQLWYYSDLNNVIGTERKISNQNHPITNPNARVQLEKYVKKIVSHFFDFEETQEYVLFAPCVSYYDTGSLLKNHSDGTNTGRICSLLIYLNENYDENNGGILVLDDKEKVIPSFGKVAIIDLQSFDINHMVTEVTGGIGRFAFLTFVKTKENEFIDY